MKKLRTTLAFLICAICLTGCMRFNTTITVKSNGRMDVSVLYAMMDMSDYGYDDVEVTESDIQDFKEEGWDVEEYNEDGFIGVLLTKENISADEFAESMEDTQSDLSDGSGSLNFTKKGSKYILDWKVFDRDETEQIAMYKNYFNMGGGYMKMTVNLPVKPTDSNATSVSSDGKTLEWDLLNLGPDQTIHLEFSLINTTLIIGICAAVFVLLLIIILIIVLVTRKKKTANMQYAGYYQQPGQYNTMQGYQQPGQYNNMQGYQQQGQYGNAQGFQQQGQYGNMQGYQQPGQYNNMQGYQQPGYQQPNYQPTYQPNPAPQAPDQQNPQPPGDNT